MMLIDPRKTAAALVVLLAAAGPAYGEVQKTFPRLRLGVGNEPNSGGGVVAGDRYVTRNAVIAWNRKSNSLTLYLLWRRRVSCATLRRTITRPGHLIQVHVTDSPRVNIARARHVQGATPLLRRRQALRLQRHLRSEVVPAPQVGREAFSRHERLRPPPRCASPARRRESS